MERGSDKWHDMHSNCEPITSSSFRPLQEWTDLYKLWRYKISINQQQRNVRVHGPRCDENECTFLVSNTNPSLAVCMDSGRIHECYRESSTMPVICSVLTRNRQYVCRMTGIVDSVSDGHSCFDDDPVSVLMADSALAAANELSEIKLIEQQKKMEERAISVFMKLITGEQRMRVMRGAQERQVRMQRTLHKGDTSSNDNYTQDVEETQMRVPIRDERVAREFARDLVRESVRLLKLMECPPKNYPVMCCAYAFVLRRGVSTIDRRQIIPPHSRMPMPGMHRMNGVPFPAKQRRLHGATEEIVHFIMNSRSAQILLERTYQQQQCRHSDNTEWKPAAADFL